MNHPWTDDEIAALIDGSIDDAETERRLRLAIETDPRAAECAAAVAAVNAALRAAHAAPLTEPTPRELLDALSDLGAKLEAKTDAEPSHSSASARRPVPTASRRERGGWRRAQPSSRAWNAVAMAACLAIVVGIGWRLNQAPSFDARSTIGLGDAPRAGALHAALETTPTGVVGPEGIRLVFTFRDGRGRYCREFEIAVASPSDTEIGLACRSDAGRWRVEIAGLAPPTKTDDGSAFSLSSGPTRRAMETLLDTIEAGPALSAAEEQKLIESGWRG